jgi:hypothetical protein
MPLKEMIAEIHAAASSLVTAAAAAENGYLAAAEIGIEDALFRTESLLTAMRGSRGGINRSKSLRLSATSRWFRKANRQS